MGEGFGQLALIRLNLIIASGIVFAKLLILALRARKHMTFKVCSSQMLFTSTYVRIHSFAYMIIVIIRNLPCASAFKKKQCIIKTSKTGNAKRSCLKAKRYNTPSILI